MPINQTNYRQLNVPGKRKTIAAAIELSLKTRKTSLTNFTNFDSVLFLNDDLIAWMLIISVFKCCSTPFFAQILTYCDVF